MIFPVKTAANYHPEGIPQTEHLSGDERDSQYYGTEVSRLFWQQDVGMVNKVSFMVVLATGRRYGE